MTQALRIVVVAPDLSVADREDAYAVSQAERSRSLRIGLLENCFNLVAVLPADAFLQERIAQLQPDMIIVDAESEARDALEHVVLATRDERRPIVMFTNDDDTSHVKAAVAAGVSAYIVAGLSSERIRPILDVAMARFQHEQALRDELASTKTELQAQSIELQEKGIELQEKGIELQAKGIELQAKGVELQAQGLELRARLAELQDRKIIERAKGILMQRQNLSEQQAYDKLRKTAMGKSLKLVDVAQRMLDVEDLMG